MRVVFTPVSTEITQSGAPGLFSPPYQWKNEIGALTNPYKGQVFQMFLQMVFQMVYRMILQAVFNTSPVFVFRR